MKKLLLFLFFFLFGFGEIHAQFTNNNWCFGDSAGIRFVPNLSIFKCGASFSRGTASISDLNGDLILYGSTSNTTNGSSGQIKEGKLFNKQHLKLFNGDTLVGGNWYHDMLILPKSILDSTFFVFVAGVVTPDTGLWYSIVDMKLQSGLGQVVQKNIRYTMNPVQDMLTAVKHGNGKDWWLVTRPWYSNATFTPTDEFRVYLIDSTGITPLPAQNLGLAHFDGAGDMSFNREGNKLVLCGWNNYLGLFDFDRCTGLISNEVVIEPDGTLHPFKIYTSAVFSSDGSKLYVNSSQEYYNRAGKLYQFDLNASIISNSRVLIDSFPVAAENFGMERGIDGKIYISSLQTGFCNYPFPPGCISTMNSNLSIINYPDSLRSCLRFSAL
ncbi:MAG: hypothetical protein IPO63_07745 [Bacteroidetes bacterium]|nr:hypothetical protein [Bacteroidota bacterium]